MIKTNKLILALAALLLIWQSSLFAQSTIVEKYGKLTIKGNYIFGENGDTVQLRGMSLFWSQWMPQYYNESCIKWLRDDWKCDIVRAAMGVDMGGYADNPEGEKAKACAVVDAAIKLGIYVIIDYHSHEAHNDPDQAKKFFAEMSKKYGKYPNVIYEVFNEPLKDAAWKTDIKPYAEGVIRIIRQFDPSNIVVVGTRQWSQLVDEAATNPIQGTNIAYTLHFYAATHMGWLRTEAKKAMEKGVCLFVTEFGDCDASGNGKFDIPHTEDWFKFMDQYHLSWCNWSVADKEETASAVKPGASGNGGWKEGQLTESGIFIRNELIKKNTPIFKTLKPSATDAAGDSKKKK